MSKILHGGRLSSVREDVAKFTSSRKDDERLGSAVIEINKAHVVMLIEQKIIRQQDGVKLLKSLSKLLSDSLDPKVEDVHMAVEEAVLSETGPAVGGNMHIAKSRNDQVATAIRMQLRCDLIEVMEKITKLQAAFIDLASKHVGSVILEYTHLQSAQPVTFAHYLLSFVQAFERDFDRIKEAYERVNLCPLGSCALATTSFPIDRRRTAELLGFDAVLENSIDAVGSRDFVLETQAAMSLLEITLSRFAEDMIIWSSREFGTIELPDDFTSTSSIMPQKKNPEVLEVIRARSSNVVGDFVASAATVKGLPTVYNLDFQEITPNLWAAIDIVCCSLDVLIKLVPRLELSEFVADKIADGFVGATELANLLVRKYGVAFRTSHKIVGALVKRLIDSKKTLSEASPELLKEVAWETAGVELLVSKEDFADCSDLRKLVEKYNVLGGPSRLMVGEAMKTLEKSIVNSGHGIVTLKKNLADAERNLSRVVESYAVSSLS